MLNAVFGARYFRGEITWVRTTNHSDAKRWSPNADIILYYGKGHSVTWNPIHVAHTEAYVSSKYRYTDAHGRRYRLDNLASPNPRPNLTYVWKGHEPPRNGWRYARETMADLDARGLNLVTRYQVEAATVEVVSRRTIGHAARQRLD